MAPGAGAASVVMAQSCEVRGTAPAIKHLPLPARKCTPATARTASESRRASTIARPAAPGEQCFASSDDLQTDVDIAPCGIGIGADLVRLGHQSFGLRAR